MRYRRKICHALDALIVHTVVVIQYVWRISERSALLKKIRRPLCSESFLALRISLTQPVTRARSRPRISHDGTKQPDPVSNGTNSDTRDAVRDRQTFRIHSESKVSSSYLFHRSLFRVYSQYRPDICRKTYGSKSQLNRHIG